MRDGLFLRTGGSHLDFQSSDQSRTELAIDALGRVSVRALLTDLLANLVENSPKGAPEHGTMAVVGLK